MSWDMLIVAAALATQGPDLRHDLQGLGTGESAMYAASGLALAGSAHLLKDYPRDELDGHWLMVGPADVTNIYGASSFNLPASAAVWGFGKATGRSGAERLGRQLTRTLTLTQLVVAPIKMATRRRRPDGSNRLSFPSGHTANAFAVARLIQREHDNRWALPFYVLAGYTAAGRIEEGRHYLSDVAMGAAMGLIVGSAVSTTTDRKSQYSVAPRFTRSGWLIRIEYRPGV